MNGDVSGYRLAVVGSGRVRGQIAMAGCPGRMAGIAIPTVSAWRLQRDVATLRHWRTQALVTLLEKSELTLMRLTKLPALLEAQGIAWYHLPLPEGRIPDERFEALWQTVAPRLRGALWCGGRIAVHCLDGRSRAAIVTAKLLVELDVRSRMRSTGCAARAPACSQVPRKSSSFAGRRRHWRRPIAPRSAWLSLSGCCAQRKARRTCR